MPPKCIVDLLFTPQAEFGAPSELLKNEKGVLRALVDESGDKEKLYEMAEGASRARSSGA